MLQEKAFSEAKKQNAFVFWNHPAWYAQSPKGTPILSDFQKTRIKNNELHGIEVINTTYYSEETLAMALKKPYHNGHWCYPWSNRLVLYEKS